MTYKEQLIIGIIEENLPSIKELGEVQEREIKKIREEGYGDIHPFYQDEIKSGISYTHGYTVGHLSLASNILSLMRMSEEDIVKWIEDKEKIKLENEELRKSFIKKLEDVDK